MKKNYCVSVDITMSKNVYIDAENEEQAKAIFSEEIAKNPYNFAHSFSHYVGYEIIDANEED